MKYTEHEECSFHYRNRNALKCYCDEVIKYAQSDFNLLEPRNLDTNFLHRNVATTKTITATTKPAKEEIQNENLFKFCVLETHSLHKNMFVVYVVSCASHKFK